VGIYTGAFLLYYLFFIEGVSTEFGADVIYVVWSVLVTYSLSVWAGSVSFCASYFFVNEIYDSIKAD